MKRAVTKEKKRANVIWEGLVSGKDPGGAVHMEKSDEVSTKKIA